MSNRINGKALFYAYTIRGKSIVTPNLFFSQAIFQHHSPDIERGKTGVSVQNRSAVPKPYAGSSGESRQSFLNNLTQISKDHHPNSQTQRRSGKKSSRSPAYSSGESSAAAFHPATGSEFGVFEAKKRQEEDLDKPQSHVAPALNLTAVLSLLEKLGMRDSAEGSNSANKVDETAGDAEGLVALNKLIAGLGQNDFGPSAEMKAELDILKQIIANARTCNVRSYNGGDDLVELSVSRSIEPADLNRMNPVTSKLLNDIRQTGLFQSAENSQAASRSENPEKTDSVKLAVTAQMTGAEANEKGKELRSSEMVRTDASGLNGGWDVPGKTGAPRQADHMNRIWSMVDSGKQFGGESEAQSLPNNESSPVSKMIHDTQLSRENHLRMDATMRDELGVKITKVDAGANENGLMSSQNHTTEKSFEATFSSMQSDTSQDSLRTQTLDQIVRKAVIYTRNGQHEAKIDLKPDFLGHIRMQVTIENQQVTVKILTESGFVKDMVENNIHQLKAGLQQQGLNIDKLEVAVSSDSDDFKHSQEKAGQANDRQRSVVGVTAGNQEEEPREQAGNFGLRKSGTAAVDYFA
jgi:flagellar hook-length control protein FliK